MKKELIMMAMAMSIGSVNAQKTKTYTTAERLYFEGKEMYDLKQYNTAFRYLDEYLQDKDVDREEYYAEAEYLLACCAYEMDRKDTRGRLERFVANNPHSSHISRILFLQGSIYFQKGKYKEALEQYFCKVDPRKLSKKEKADYFFRHGYCNLQLQDYDKAHSSFTTLCDLNNDNYQKSGKYYLAYIDYLKKNYDAALPTFISLQNDSEYESIVPYYIAQIYYYKNMDEKVFEYGLSIIEKYPNNKSNSEIYRIIGECYFKKNDYKQTIKYLSEYAKTTDQIMRNNIYMLGTSYCKTQDWKNAIENLQKVTTENDELSQNAYLNLGNSYLKVGDKTNARMCFAQASKMEFDKEVQEEAMFNYALVVYDQSYSPFDESVTTFENFLEKFPKSNYKNRIYDYLLNVYMTTKNYEAAYASIQKINTNNPSILEARQRILYCLGIQSFTDGDYEKAKDYLTKSLIDKQYNYNTESLAYFWRGEANFRLNKPTEAQQDYLSFINTTGARHSDVYNLAHYNLGYCYFNNKSYTSALTWFRKFTNLEDNNKTLIADANNRIGDCYFINHDFENAEKSYSKVYALKGSGADYACFQQGFVQGLQKNYNGKIATLNRLISKFPNSEYIADAMYEIGRSYVMLNDYKSAITTYEKLSKSYFHSPLSRKGKLQTAMLHDKMGDFEQSTKIYKSIVDMFPSSEEAKTSLEGLKRIYFDQNNVSGYAEYVESLGGIAKFEISEQDSLTYLAAEKLYLQEKYQEAINSFNKYLDKFPNSIFNESAHFNLGNSYYNIKEYDLAKKELSLTAQQLGSVHAEQALLLLADIEYKKENYEQVVEHLEKMVEITQNVENKEKAKLQIMRSYNKLGKIDETISACDNVIKGDKLDPNLYREALYTRAKCYEQKGETNYAVADYKTLSSNCLDEFGAEAKYKTAEYAFHDGNKEAAEKIIFEFIDQNTPHQYWLAKSFVLLADIYVSMDREFEAKQYLLSVRENYKGKDDIALEIKSRLDDIEAREKNKIKE